MSIVYARLCFAIAILVAVSSNTHAQSRASTTRLSFSAENQLAIERRDEVIAVPWSRVTATVSSARPDRVRVIDDRRRETASQVIDNDGDGKPDDLLLLADFRAKETREFAIEAVASALKAEPRVFIRHDDPRDDMAWESDRIAFRIYGEGLKKTPSAMSSNGIDVWPKRVHALIVDKWYKKGHDAYHIDTGEGADFFDVGETLGAGGTAIWKNDSIYRADNFKAWKTIANGPIRAIFELRYDPWKGGGLTVSETKRISIDAGQNLYKSVSIFRSEGGGEIPYAIGLVKRPGMRGIESSAEEWAWLSGWGPVAPKNGGHGELGTAVLLPRSRVKDWKEIKNHYLAISTARSGEPVVHYVGAGWTASGDFPTPQSWWAYLDNFSRRVASPIKVTFGGSATGGQ
ncbi:MAG TPA: DUF4861 domain-containing protein [Gemmatimonadaceae bacterium]|nr:DUF4861 domain-containing protein [Gemmatimonadaceae bacterium]